MRNTKRRHLVLTLTLAAAMAFCLIPSAASAAERTVNPGHHHVDVDIYKVPASEQGGVEIQTDKTYPAKLDPRNEEWYKENIEVRDQYNSNLCWSFSANKAAMISYAKECYEKTGEVTEVAELSPIHLGYFLYNRTDDPLGNTPADNPGSELADFNFNADNANWFTEGGNVINTFQHMATWSGLTKESYAPFTTEYDPQADADVYSGPMELDDDLAYEDELVETGCTFYKSVKEDPDKLKYVVEKHGAAVVSMFFGNSTIPLDDYINGGYNLYNPDGYMQNNNHEVVVIGWDDNYPASNFSSKRHDRAQGRVSPQRNGAWLVMNSWGDDWGQNGYFWVSYDSEDILCDGVCGFDMATTDTYDYNFQYDGNANSYNWNMVAGDKAANLYLNDTGKTISLKAVGLTEYNDGNTDYNIDIYTDVTESMEETAAGAPDYTMQVSTDSPGYKTFELNQSVEIAPNKVYAIVVNMLSPKTLFGIESNDCDTSESPIDWFKDFTKFRACNPKEQCFSYDTEFQTWEDMGEMNISFRIKGLASETVPQPTSTTTTTAAPTTDPSQGEGGSDIVLKATKIKKISKGKKSLTVKWKKSTQIVEGKHITGYQIRYSLKRSMKDPKTVTVKGFAKTSKKIKKLKKKKTYYVQVRTVYIDDRGAEHFSAWSKKKSKKTR